MAFHATERPDDPPIGVWRFDRTDFDEANLDLQQRGGFSYARLARLECVLLTIRCTILADFSRIMPLPLADIEEVIFETSPDPEPELLAHEKPKVKASSTSTASQVRERRKKTQKLKSKNARKDSEPQRRAAAATQLSPPLTLGSSRNPSKSTKDKSNEGNVLAKNTNNWSAKVAEATRSSGSRKSNVTKRKPKRPLVSFGIESVPR